MKLKADYEIPKSREDEPLLGKWKKEKADSEKQKSQEDKQKLRQWKKDKALQVTKEVGKDLLLGMANGLSMYGQVAPSLYFGTPLPSVPNYSNNTKKW